MRQFFSLLFFLFGHFGAIFSQNPESFCSPDLDSLTRLASEANVVLRKQEIRSSRTWTHLFKFLNDFSHHLSQWNYLMMQQRSIVHPSELSSVSKGFLKEAELIMLRRMCLEIEVWVTEASKAKIAEDALTSQEKVKLEQEVSEDHIGSGPFQYAELLRRSLFQDYTTDKGILKTLTKRAALAFKGPPIVFVDLGAGNGQYSDFFRNTGIFNVFAFDGTWGVEEITDGKVHFLDLSRDIRTGTQTGTQHDGECKTTDPLSSPINGEENICPLLTTDKSEPSFEVLSLEGVADWALCVEVGEHIPQHKEEAFIRNLNYFVKVSGFLVISWGAPSEDEKGIGHVNLRTPEEVDALLEKGGFVRSEVESAHFAESSEIEWIRRTIAVYRKTRNIHE